MAERERLIVYQVYFLVSEKTQFQYDLQKIGERICFKRDIVELAIEKNDQLLVICDQNIHNMTVMEVKELLSRPSPDDTIMSFRILKHKMANNPDFNFNNMVRKIRIKLHAWPFLKSLQSA